MDAIARQEATCGNQATGASWRAVTVMLAGELAAVRCRLANIERILGLPTPPAAPERCHRRPTFAGQDDHGPDCASPQPLAPPAAPPTNPTVGLSRREAEVLRLLAAGRSNQQIAATLCLSPRTVQRHIANAYLKIGAHNKAEATVYALRHRLI